MLMKTSVVQTATLLFILLLAQIVTAEQFGPQVDPCATLNAAGDTWLDRVHALVQDKTCEPAVWFDNFFGTDHVLLDLRPGTFIILRNSARLTEGFDVTYATDFYLTLDLPKWERLLRKARLYIESGSDADKYTFQPGHPVQPGIDRETGVSQPVVGVRVDPYIRPEALVSIDSGIKINMHPDAFIRMRYQYSKAFGEVYLIRFSEIAMWGVNDPGWTIQNYRVGSLYRLNFYRPWLFFEIAPEVTWPKDESGHRESTYALMSTIEIQFGK